MLKLHAVYREAPNGTWEATIEFHPFILVEGAPCIESAREMLILYTAEEIQAAHAGHRCNWTIVKETIL